MMATDAVLMKLLQVRVPLRVLCSCDRSTVYAVAARVPSSILTVLLFTAASAVLYMRPT